MFCTLLIQSFLVQYYHPLIDEINVCTVEHNIIEPMVNTKLQDLCNMIKNKQIHRLNEFIYFMNYK